MPGKIHILLNSGCSIDLDLLAYVCRGHACSGQGLHLPPSEAMEYCTLRRTSSPSRWT